MNKIQASTDKSDYGNHTEFLNIQIDGEWLDEFLDRHKPDSFLKGLIPTLCFRMERDEENKIVWNRILPKTGEKRMCPILMCPDDMDFSCTIVIVQIENTGKTVKWSNFGFDRSKNTFQQPEAIGRSLEFIQGPGVFEFSMEEYIDFLNAFKTEYLKDQEEWNLKYPEFPYSAPF